MQSMENKVHQFFDNLEKAYEGVDLYLSEIEETLSIYNKTVRNNQILTAELEKEKNKKSKKPKIQYKRKALKVEIRDAIVRRIKKQGRRISKLTQDEMLKGKKGGLADNIRKKNADTHSVSVIIPTYTPNDLLDVAVKSVLAQKEIDGVQVIIGVNGSNKDWYEELCARYKADANIDVLYTETPGISAGRNICKPIIRCNYIFYLDDDDYITEHLFEELFKCMESETEFVTAPFYNSDTGYDNYITNKYVRFLKSNTNSKSFHYLWLFGVVTGKLYRKSLIDKCTLFDESIKAGEDVLFWSENFDKVKGGFACLNPETGEHYYRLVRENSLGRVADTQRYIKDRIDLIKRLEKKIFEFDYTINAKRLAVKYIGSQQILMERKLQDCSEDNKAAAIELIDQYEGFYLNKGRFSESNAIAFCHNFAPYIDASSMVASKRLRQIDDLTDTSHSWTVVDKNMTGVKDADPMYDMFYAKHIYTKKFSLGGRTAFLPKNQTEFGMRAFNRVKNLKADVIYSRALYPGSHIAAYLYKKAYPDTIWYAEFSDPAQYNGNGKSRKVEYQGDKAIFNDFWEIVEIAPYLCADYLIFTNEVQRDYMLSYNNYPEYNDEILKKSLVMNHPQIGDNFANIKKSKYKLDESKINIGYFGTFYKKRSFETIEPLCNNPNVVLHVFTNKPETIDSEHKNIKIAGLLPYFEFLNVASRMDYVVLADMDSDFGWIPWLPSKYSDYISAGTKIIALVLQGSPLYNMTHENLIKVETLDDEFINSLEKQK